MLSRFASASSKALKPSILYRALKSSSYVGTTPVNALKFSTSAHVLATTTFTKTSLDRSVDDLVKSDMKNLHSDICKMFETDRSELKEICDYYFDGSGKAIRPLIICAWARALNKHIAHEYGKVKEEELSFILKSQRQIALISEMIHVSSLIHDDIIDNSDLRRGKTSVNSQWGCHKAVMAGDYVLAVSSKSLAQLGNAEVVETLSQVLEDLVQGELMQFGSKEAENERFEHYTTKTYRKTASLIANSCKSIALLAKEKQKSNLDLAEMSFEFGKNLGIAFQLIDDVLDFTSQSDNLGKPGSGADLRLGLATAPVLFAAGEFPQLNVMIMRRFSNEGDVKKAFEYVMKSKGIEETRFLAAKYCQNAEKILDKLHHSNEIDHLRGIVKSVIDRKK